jgi:rod shape-determining protein MreC
MAVVTPEGIVGKVVDAYPMSSLIMVLNDPTFASGVISEKNHVRGTLKGQGHSECLVDYVQNEEKVEVGEMFYTSGDDRIFPRGFPVGQVRVVRNGKTFKEIYVAPSGFQGSVEAVLVVLQGVHQAIPDHEITSTPGYKILSPPVELTDTPATGQPPLLSTDADRLREQYKQSGEAQKHVFGEVGSKAPDFSKIPGVRASTPPPQTPGAPIQKPPEKEAAVVKPPPPKVEATPVAAAPPPKARPKPTGPLLVTDPTDADPGSEAIPFKPPASKQPAQKPPGTAQ